MRKSINEKKIKFTIIIPTYNDSETIESTISSIETQTYQNWEIIIMNDGSTDNTENILRKYIKHNPKISYFYQENSDQLNAVLNSIPYITGDYVLILHSDDVLASKETLEKSYYYFNKNNCDAIIGNLEIMDDNENFIGVQKVLKYKNKEYIKALQLLWLGRNLYVDTAIFKKDFFVNTVKENYLTWNMPFWLSFNPQPEMANVHKVDFSLIKYRVFTGNYINNEIGMLNVINGELRTAITLMNFYTIPFFKIQYFIFRFFNKLGLLTFYRPIFVRNTTKNKGKIINFILSKRFNDFNKYKYFSSLSKFYNHISNRKIKLKLDNTKLYYGKDMRIFNKKMLDDKLGPTYNRMLDEMYQGFKTIIVEKKDYAEIITMLKFLGIYYDVVIEIRE